MKFYTDFVIMTDKQYEHCTLEEKLTVYVQHYPAVVVPLLKELIEKMNHLELKVKEGFAHIDNGMAKLKELEDIIKDLIEKETP